MNDNHKPDHGHHNDHDNDNGARAVAPAPTGKALTSLTALSAVLNSVDTARSRLPLMQYKSRENTHSFGQRETIPEDDSRWAVDPTTFQWGYVSFSGTANKPPLGEVLVSVGQPKPDVTELRDTGFPWQEQWAVQLKCISGVDAGTEVIFKSNTVGGIQAIAGLIDKVRDRLNAGEHGGKIVAILKLVKDSYQHEEFGRVWYPVLEIIDWMSLDGPAPEPAPAPTKSPTAGGSSPAEQPRRRRAA
jgi:hypothetical protein